MKIVMRDLFYIYKNNGESIVALRGLNLEANTGECLVIKGPNGSGKSTLVKLLTGYYTPTAGEIIVDGQDTATVDTARLRRELIASLDQQGNLVEDLSVLQNLELAFALSHQEDVRELAESLLAEHQLSDLSSKYPSHLSAGQRQFLSLLAALATRPKVLIADEPTGELDDDSAALIYGLLKEVSHSTIVILVTHDARADKYADRIVRIREGRISEEWKPGEPEQSIIDAFGWMRVQEIAQDLPVRQRMQIDSEPIISVQNLALSYGDRQIFTALNFKAKPGELVVLDSTRSPGSGKSSLLRILAGLQEPSAGEVTVLDKLLGSLDRGRRAMLRRDSLSYLGQRAMSVEHLTLSDFLNRTGVDLGPSLNARFKSAMATFSGGEKGRIELSKIIVEARPILLLDEPTSQMDDRKTFEVIALLYKYLEAGGLAVVSTRNEHLIQAADQIIELS